MNTTMSLAHGKTAWPLWAAVMHWMRTRRQRRRMQRELALLAELSPDVLRDLGLSVHELGSVHAEAFGHAERTRRRVALLHGLP